MANRDTSGHNSGGKRPGIRKSPAASGLIRDLRSLISAGRAHDGAPVRRRRKRPQIVDGLSAEAAAHLAAGPHLESAEVGALIDLGLSDGAVAAYLLHRDDLAAPRRRASPSAGTAATIGDHADILYRALGRVSAAAMRRQARQLIFAARHSADAEQRTSLAARAFEITDSAEALERRAEPEELPTPAVAVSPRARAWRQRAEEYRTIADALTPGTARDTYLHLARAYDGLAARWER